MYTSMRKYFSFVYLYTALKHSFNKTDLWLLPWEKGRFTMINPFDTTTKTGMIVRGAEIISNVGTFVLTLKNGAKLSDVKTNTEDIKSLSRQNISRTADINDLLRYYFPKPQQPLPQAQPVMAPAPQAVPPAVAPMGFTQPVVAQQPQPVIPAAPAVMPVQQSATAVAPPANNTANTVPVQQPVPQAPAPQAPQQPQEQPQPQPQGNPESK